MDAITERTQPRTSSDQVGGDHQPLSWKPFAQLDHITQRSLGERDHGDQSQAGKSANGVENHPDRRGSDDL